jgi:hypothetical protein
MSVEAINYGAGNGEICDYYHSCYHLLNFLGAIIIYGKQLFWILLGSGKRENPLE